MNVSSRPPSPAAAAAAFVEEEPSNELLLIEAYNMWTPYLSPPRVVRLADSGELIGPYISELFKATGAQIRDLRMCKLPSYWKDEDLLKSEVQDGIRLLLSVDNQVQSIGKALLQSAEAGSVIRKLMTEVAAALEGAEAIALSGGENVEPEFYIPDIPFSDSDYFRTITEFAALMYAEQRGIPVIATCRGCQILNAYHGGTIKNVDGQKAVWQELTFTDSPQSEKIRALFSRTFAVSSHQQACDRIAPGFTKVLEFDGVTKLIISDDDREIGVQFHPELPEDKYSNSVRKYSNSIKLHEIVYQKIMEQREKDFGEIIEV